MVASGADGNFGALVDGVDQTAATRADGWTVAKNASPLSAEFDVGTKQASGTFSSNSTTPKPGSFLTGATANAFKTPAPLSGTFAATAWTLTFAVRATTASSQAGRMRLRVFRSVNADGSAATEITSATQVGATSSALSTSADVTSAVTWTPASTFTLNNEYLFFVIAWEITTAGGSNSCDVQIRTGQAAGGSRFVTSNFTPTPNTPVSLPATTTLTPGMGLALKFNKTQAATASLTPGMSFSVYTAPTGPGKAFTVRDSTVRSKDALRFTAPVVNTPVQLDAGLTLTPAISRKLSAVRTNAVTATLTAALTRKLLDVESLPANVVFTTGLTTARGASRTLAAGITFALTAGVKTGKLLGIALPITFTPTMGKFVQGARTFAASLSLVPAMQRLIKRAALAAGMSVTPTMTQGKAFGRPQPVTVVFITAQGVKKLLGLSLPATPVITPSMTRLRSGGRALAATVVFTPGMSRTAFLAKTFAANVVFTGTQARFLQAYRTLAAGMSVFPQWSQRKTYARAISASITFIPAQVRAYFLSKKLDATITFDPHMVVARRGQTATLLDAVMTLTPAMQKSVFAARTFAANVVFTAAMTRVRMGFRTLPTGIVFTPGIIAKSLYSRSLAAPVSFVAALTRRYVLGRVFNSPLTLTGDMTAAKQGKANTYLNAVLTLTPTMSRQMTKSLAALLNFIPGMGKKVPMRLALTFTLVPAQTKVSRLGRIFGSVATFQVGMQRGTTRKVAFSLPVPMIVAVIVRQPVQVRLHASAIFTAALGFVRQHVRKPVDTLFSTALDPAQLLAAGEDAPDLVTVEMEGMEEETHLLSAGNGAAELESVGEDAPVLRSVS